MKIFIYTYDQSDRNLPGFAYCFNKYWSPWVDVTVLGYRYPPYALPPNFVFQCVNATGVCDKPWSFYLYRWLYANAPDQFVFAGDDHWISNYVDLGAVAMLDGAVRAGAAKANLSADGAFYFRHSDRLTGELIIKPSAEDRPPLNWKYSLQPAIWRKDYLLNALCDPKGISPWTFEERGRTMQNSIADRVVSCKHAVWPMTGVEGVQHAGQPYVPNICALAPEDLRALKELGYPDIHKGDLRRELV